MTYKLKLRGGEYDGKEFECELVPPEIIDGSGEDTFFYLDKRFYILYVIDHDNREAYYETIEMQNNPVAEKVGDMEWKIYPDGESS